MLFMFVKAADTRVTFLTAPHLSLISILLVCRRKTDLYSVLKQLYPCNIFRSDDPLVMAGLGTLGLEIITQLPEADAVIVPVGSGGLLASVLIACKKLKCSCLVYVSYTLLP